MTTTVTPATPDTDGDGDNHDQLTLGAMISTARDRMGWSQQDLAEAVGVKQQTISRWEADLIVPDFDRVPRLCSALPELDQTKVTDRLLALRMKAAEDAEAQRKPSVPKKPTHARLDALENQMLTLSQQIGELGALIRQRALQEAAASGGGEPRPEPEKTAKKTPRRPTP